MGKKILIVVLVVSLLANAYLFSTSQAQSARVDRAADLAQSLQSYFATIGFQCSAAYDDVDATTECLDELRSSRTGLDSLDEEDYENAGDEEQGYIVLQNSGSQSFNSSSFTLLHNREPVDTGCTIDGAIEDGYTCRLNFDAECQPGDVLEVQYNGSRAFLRNC